MPLLSVINKEGAVNFFILVLILVFNASCSVVNDEEEVSSNNFEDSVVITKPTNSSNNDDYDVDGISNDDDPEPFVANLPNLSVENIGRVELSFRLKNNSENIGHSLVFEQNRSDKIDPVFIKSKLFHLSYKVLLNENINLSDHINSADSEVFTLTKWNRGELYKSKHLVEKSIDALDPLGGSFLYTFNLKKSDSLFTVSDIQVDIVSIPKGSKKDLSQAGRLITLKSTNGGYVSFEKDDEIKTAQLFSFGHKKEYLKKIIDDGNEIGSLIKDYKYSFNNKEFLYTDQISKIRSNNANFVIIDPEGNRIQKFISPDSNYSFLEALSTFSRIEQTNGRIDSFFGVKNDLSDIIDWSNINVDDLALGGWVYFSSENTSLNSKIAKGQTYVAVYLKLKDIIEFHQENLQFEAKDKKNFNTLFFSEKPFPNMGIEGIFSYKVISPYRASTETRTTPCHGEYTYKQCEVIERRRVCYNPRGTVKTCSYEHTNIAYSHNSLKSLDEIYKALLLSSDQKEFSSNEIKELVDVLPIDENSFFLGFRSNELAGLYSGLKLSFSNLKGDNIHYGVTSGPSPHFPSDSWDHVLFGWDQPPKHETGTLREYLVDYNYFLTR